MICGTADHRSGSTGVSRNDAPQQRPPSPPTAKARYHRQHRTKNRDIRWTARQQQRNERPIEVQEAWTPSEDQHCLSKNKPKDRPRPAQPTANRSAIDRRICDGHILLLPRQQECLSPHARNQTRDRGNRLHRKKSTLRIPAEQPSPT
jgi:hypothetical protein